MTSLYGARGFHEESEPQRTGPANRAGPVPLEARRQSLLPQPDCPAYGVKAGDRFAVRGRARLGLGEQVLQAVLQGE
jgi:hypothetical protein